MESTETDWASYFNKRFGANITQANVSIIYPLVQLFTSPRLLFDDGTTIPPKIVREYVGSGRDFNNVPYDPAPPMPDKYPFEPVDSNPNWRDGHYFPEYSRNTIHYELPEFPSSEGSRLLAPKSIKYFPLEVRRRM